MQSVLKVTDDIFWVGGNDRRLERFENIFPLPHGVSYNSYLIRDEKTCLMDSVDECFIERWLDAVEEALAGRDLDYLVITHMEPDHGAGLARLCKQYPNVKLVGNAKMFTMIGQFFEVDLSAHFYEVKETDTLNLGKHILRFMNAPMVHWPEVMFVYEEATGILFTADAFGTFGALQGNLFADEVDFDCLYLDEARRYYANIVGKYGPQVQAALKKANAFDIKMICPLHGPVFRKDIPYILEKYDRWSRYEPEQKGVVIAYGSMYGHTEAAVNVLSGLLGERGIGEIHTYDVSKTHHSYVISDIFEYSHLVLAAPTYNMGLYLPMETLVHDIAALNLQNRKVAIIGNGTWAPQSQTIMAAALEKMKDMEQLGEAFVLKSALKDAQMPALTALADAIAASVKG